MSIRGRRIRAYDDRVQNEWVLTVREASETVTAAGLKATNISMFLITQYVYSLSLLVS
jgi:hypothetical protein